MQARHAAGQDQIFAKCAWRLVPLLAVMLLINWLDRVNVGFAALTMNRDLGFSPSVYGMGAGFLFAGYLIFQLPATFAVQRFGVRWTVFCIMACWGIMSASCAFVTGPRSFYGLRFLLGAAEAGFYPGMIFYLTLWFPKQFRARYAAAFSTATSCAGIVGSPLSGLILTHIDGLSGLHGWQWLFLLEGMPAALLAFAAVMLLPNSPAGASWLSAAEKSTISTRIAGDGSGAEPDFGRALRDRRVLLLLVAGLLQGMALYGTALWLPLMVQGIGFSTTATGFVAAIAYLASAALTVVWARSSDIRDERIWHAVGPWLLCAAGLQLASIAHTASLQVFGLSLAVVGVFVSAPQFMLLVSWFLKGPAAAGAIALLNSAVSLGGIAGPSLIGILRQGTGSYAPSMVFIGAGLVLASLLVLAIGRSVAPRTKTVAAE